MELTPKDARNALLAADSAASVSIGATGGPSMLIVWGVVAILGFLGSQFIHAPDVRDTLWAVLLVIANILSAILGQRIGGRVRSRSGLRIALLSMCVFAYAVVWILIARPLSWQQTSLLATSALLMLYIAIGLWVEAPLLLWIGGIGTADALSGYLFLHQWFGLWMALTIGGGFITVGVLGLLPRGERTWRM